MIWQKCFVWLKDSLERITDERQIEEFIIGFVTLEIMDSTKELEADVVRPRFGSILTKCDLFINRSGSYARWNRRGTQYMV